MIFLKWKWKFLMKSEMKMKIFNQKRLKFENDFYFLFPFLIIL